MTTKKKRVSTGLSSAATAHINRHKHDHCKHEKLKFCAQCNRPHCLACGTEWAASSWAYTVPYYTTNANNSGTYTMGNVTSNSLGAIGQALGTSSGSATAKGHTH